MLKVPLINLKTVENEQKVKVNPPYHFASFKKIL